MSLKEVRDSWNALGALDPMWSILTDGTDKLGNKWREAEFFESGRREIDEVMLQLHAVLEDVPKGRALDFGCGIGRLSRALAAYFTEVVGVDIAASMVAEANALNREPGRCRFVLNDSDDLSIFGDATFDFIYSNIVLQHVPPRNVRRYLLEFGRLLTPDGVLVFQLPDVPKPNIVRAASVALSRLLPYAPRFLIDYYRRLKYRTADAEFLKRLPRVLMRMEGSTPFSVARMLADAGLTPKALRRLPDLAPDWKNYRYIVTRQANSEGAIA